MSPTASSKKSQTIWVSLWGRCIYEWPEVKDTLLLALQKSGLHVSRLGYGAPNGFVTFDYHRRTFFKFGKKVSKEKRILVCYEPQAVMPLQYKSRVRERFKKTFVSSPWQLVNSSDRAIIMGNISIPDGFSVLSQNSTNWHARLPAFVMLNENKFSWERHNQYRYRIKTLNSFAKLGADVRLGGAKWDMTRWRQLRPRALSLLHSFSQLDVPWLVSALPPYRPDKSIVQVGRVPSGNEFLQQFRYQLVIENDRRYVSEKLEDAIVAGTIPIYSGPDLSWFGIPEEAVIRLESLSLGKASLSEILKILDSRSQKIRDSGRNWLQDQINLQGPWLREESHSRLAKAISQELGIY